ncbi:PREDICTED: protein BIG GRAIN 1-like E [Tarenaya hassleriana]|uniref:protein BIG GRAIN 1-like E n=1 Tax=Tarenaya hassleriana TaxID=28532 RepID=UPI00053C3095|nr:PREDICTED: protein BIG GRAIN 1-like E [Tarenaya hassleriana]
MSMKGLSSSSSSSSDPYNIFKGSSHKPDGYRELDVFKAARYFSGYNEPTDDTYDYTRKENRRKWGLARGRISLDLPIRSSESIHHHHKDHHVHERHEVFTVKEKIGDVKHKQPGSPGGKIASFLNSLFHQEKSKSKSTTGSQAPDEEESPGGCRRRRRSSISRFLIMISNRSSKTDSATTNSSAKSPFSSSSSGFRIRTPPPCLDTPTKNYGQYSNIVETDKNKDLTWLDDRLKLIENLSEGQRVWSEEDDRRKTNVETAAAVEDDGTESDSSSDLFELQNYDLSCGGLPVYETTNVDAIKKSAHARPV